MRELAYRLVDVFTDRPFGGNPLAVFPDARGLDDAEMQALAGELNLAETSFVLPPDDPAHDARVRIFTPRYEMPFAGHPNIGTAFVLGRECGKDALAFEEQAGLVQIELIRAAGGVVGARLVAPQPLTVAAGPSVALVAACAGLDPADFVGEPVLAGVGVRFALAELASIEALRRASPDLGAFAAGAREFGREIDLHLYVRGEPIATRNFGPSSGIVEDPATGSANAALAALLLERDGEDAHDLTIVQGVEMGRPSLIEARAWREGGQIRAGVGGRCVALAEGVFRL
jgi:trans-2,3-dihydro-3-hydroxyanthranilate isomerase